MPSVSVIHIQCPASPLPLPSVVGADRIARNGDTANKVSFFPLLMFAPKVWKIGTYNAAVLAKRHNIPFIVVAPVSTIDLSVENGSG